MLPRRALPLCAHAFWGLSRMNLRTMHPTRCWKTTWMVGSAAAESRRSLSQLRLRHAGLLPR